MTKLVRPVRGGEGAAIEPRAGDSRRLSLASDREPERPLRVLVIDDDEAILDLLAECLEMQGYAIRTTSSADAFYRELDDFQPDVVITDLAMPSHDGLEVLRSIKGKEFRGDIIIMSGTDGHVLGAARRMAAAQGLNIVGVLRKPFTPAELIALVSRNMHSDSAMGTELSERRIRPYFQPKVDLKTGKIVGAEALSRWLHPQRGVLLPQGYLKQGRSTSRQCVHDYTILERAVEFCAKLNASGHKLTIAVNFNADVILSKEFIEILTDVQQRHGVDPGQIVVELTEEEAVQNFDELAERLLKLRLFGAQLSIDDFGTGHSSLSRIQNLPASEIKIDRSFVSDLPDFSDNVAIVKSIVDLAHSLHCAVVAEGVETVDTMEMLRKVGCDMAQGHLFSPAVNEATFLALVRDNSTVLGTIAKTD
jgi:EAL domain-containing protein (putative c-di-GMP-specific phosphodiesterase class I)